MKFEVPDSFLNLLMKCGGRYSSSPSTIINILKWASENREAAEKIAEEAKRFNETGRREFEYCLLRLSYKPDEALKRALEIQMERRAMRSLLSKAITHAKRGGFTLKMANGLECRITYERGRYIFLFKPGGVNVKVIHNGRFLGETLSSLSRLSTFSSGKYGIEAIILDGKKYSRWEKRETTILEAIKKNINPYVYMTVKGND